MVHLSPVPDALTAWESYQRMQVKLAGRISRELAAVGLSEADHDILAALAQHDDAVRSLNLRGGLDWEKSRLSHQLRRMEQRGLITRHECLDDNRSSVVSLTPAGREIFEAASIVYDRAVFTYVTGVLTPEQISQLGSISEAILPALETPHRP